MDTIINNQSTMDINNYQSTSSNTQNTTITNSNNTYSSKLKQKQQQQPMTYPDKEQGIILNGYPEIHLEEYLLALTEIIEPTEILAASRISNNRINIFLRNKNTVQKITTNNKFLQIQGKQIEIRKYATPTKRILISHCSPIIPNNILEEKLREIGMRLASPIMFLRIGSKYPQFKDVLSFRRHVYIIADDNLYIPESIEVQLEVNFNYKIYLSEDNIKCTKCNRNGHTENQCYQNTQSQVISTQEINTPENEQPIIFPQPRAEPNTPDTEPILPQQIPQYPRTKETVPEINLSQNNNKPVQQTSEQQKDDTQDLNMLSTPNKSQIQIENTPNDHTQQQNKKNNGKLEKNTTEEILELTEQIKILQRKTEKLKQQQKQTLTNPSQNEKEVSLELIDLDNQTPLITSTPTKRALLSPEPTDEENQQNKAENKTNPTNKKPKPNVSTEPKPTTQKETKSTTSKDDLEPYLQSIKTEMEQNPSNYVLTYPKLKHFLENTPSKDKDKLQFAMEYTDNIQELTNMLQNLYKLLTDPKIKKKFTRIINNINPNPKTINLSQDGDIIMEL